MFGGIELQQQHDENAVVWQLLEFCVPNVMVLDQHPNYDAQHLEEQSESNKEHVNQVRLELRDSQTLPDVVFKKKQKTFIFAAMAAI